MSIVAGIHQIEEMGFQLEVDDEYLYVCPASKLDPAWLEWLRANKPLVRAYLLRRDQFQRTCMGAVTLGRAGLWD
jgi:hypothetical protein